MSKRTTLLVNVLVFVFVVAHATVSLGEALSGRVYEGQTGTEPPTAKALAGVTVGLYGSGDAGNNGTGGLPIQTTTTNSEGWYSLTVRDTARDFYNIVQTNKTSYVDSTPSPAATSVGGTVKSSNWIQYRYEDIFITPVPMTGNKFWDLPEGQPPANNPPVADAGGPYSTQVGMPVQLDGSGSYDPDAGDSITKYEWYQFSLGSYHPISGAHTTPISVWVPPGAGRFTVKLEVTDSHGESDTDTATVTVEEGGEPPADKGTLEGYKRDADTRTGLENWRIFIDINGNGEWDEGEPYDLTDSNGYYQIPEVEPDTYRVCEQMQDGWEPAEGGSACVEGIDIIAGTTTTLDFSNRRTEGPEPGTATICGVKFNDLDGDGQRDAGEPGLPGWQITLEDGDGNLLATTTTDGNGYYAFTDLASGAYRVDEVQQTGWRQTYPEIDGQPGVWLLGLEPDQVMEDVDFGNRRTDQPGDTGEIRGRKWNDRDGQGDRDPEEEGLEGWRIFAEPADSANGVWEPGELFAITDALGNYVIMDLSPGTYQVSESDQPGWFQTFPPEKHYSGVMLSQGQVLLDRDFGNRQDDTPPEPPEGEWDFGDAPEGVIDGNNYNYPTTLANNGARHKIVTTGPWLGYPWTGVDAEPDGQPSVRAEGDDLDGYDDEGDCLSEWPVQGRTVKALIDVRGGGGYVDAWIDFNRDGTWQHPQERILSLLLPDGFSSVDYVVPDDAVPGATYVRVRVNSKGPLPPYGPADDGEVEDDMTRIYEADYGDAPDPPYPTLDSSGGPWTMIPYRYLGTRVDGELDGQPDPNALGDDNNGVDDDDGVRFATTLIPGQEATVKVVVSGLGFDSNAEEICAWIDYNQNGNWESSELAIRYGPLKYTGKPEEYECKFTVPAGAVLGTTYARFTVTYHTFWVPIPPEPLQGYAYGEIEDYEIVIGEDGPYPPWVIRKYDYGDAAGYPTLLINNGARHVVDEDLFLGYTIDSETDGRPTPNADGDDNTGDNDEDGVTMSPFIAPGQAVPITVVASAAGVLNAWIDFNIDGDWADAGEHIIAAQPVSAGVNSFTMSVPANARLGQTYARFRLSSVRDLSYDGQAPDGEVEDYLVEIKADGPGLPPGGIISGFKWNDLNNNGQWDTLGGSPEPPLAGWTIWLDSNHNGRFDNQDLTEETDGRGYFQFTGLAAGTYIVGEVPQPGWTQTFPSACGPHTVSVSVNGQPPWEFEVTAGNGTVGDSPYLAMGSSGTDTLTAFDVDYVAVNTASDVYVYNGDAAAAGPSDAYDSLDGTWDHDNGSDQWDGTGPGWGGAGGAAALVEDGVTFLRIQDTGNPTSFGFSDPSNCRIYFTHRLEGRLDGARLEFQTRIATTSPLDDRHDRGTITPWPVEGIACDIRDGGKGMIGIGDPEVGVLSFSLARREQVAGLPGFEDVTSDFLVMNSLVGAEATGDVDTDDEAEGIVARNWLAVDDVTQWNSVVVDITAAGAGTHTVRIEADQTFFRSVVFGNRRTDGPGPGQQFDYGDAPVSYGNAWHTVDDKLSMGPMIDAENSANSSPGAGGDDAHNTDDEDGMTLMASLKWGAPATVCVDIHNDGSNVEAVTVAGWIDFDGNGHWDPLNELIGMRAVQVPPASIVNESWTFTVPQNAKPGVTLARFRLYRTDPNPMAIPFAVLPTGDGGVGEVEDYQLYILSSGPGPDDELDYGDAPYASASHSLGGSWLGNQPPDGETVTQSNPPGLGDDTTGIDDEDGLVFLTDLVPGQHFAITWKTNSTGPAFQSAAWIDFNRDGDWDDFGDLVGAHGAKGFPGQAWTLTMSYSLPADAQPGKTYARLRVFDGVSIYATVAPSGLGGPGEVEDYEVEIKPAGVVLPPGEIVGGVKFNDQDGDGMWDTGEPGLGGWTIWIDLNGNGVKDAGEDTLSNPDGTFYFMALSPGTYTVHEGMQPGWTQTCPGGAGLQTITVQAGQPTPSVLFGNRRTGMPAPDGIVHGYKWNDLNGDGIRDPGEPWMAGWTFWLDTNNNGQQDAGDRYEQTDGTGHFRFAGVPVGTYTLGEQLQAGWTQTTPGGAGIYTVTMQAGQGTFPMMFGNRQSAGPTGDGRICGSKWHDLNADGAPDAAEPSLANWKIYLDLNLNRQWDMGEPFQLTDAKGSFEFTGLAVGSHTVAEEMQPGWSQTWPGGAGAHVIQIQPGVAPACVLFGNQRGGGSAPGGQFDWGDAPDPTYPTLGAGNGAYHSIVAGVFLGGGVDGETDGQPTPDALGDDHLGAGDDEDGVFFLTPLMPGQPADVEVVASTDGIIDAWIDFDGDGSWAQASDQILTSVAVLAGNDVLSFVVPAGAATGIDTYARFRFSTQGGLSYDGSAQDGEVEDYHILLGPEGPGIPGEGEERPHVKWSQPPIETDPNVDPNTPPVFCGWNEPARSTQDLGDKRQWRMDADDFHCLGPIPITRIRWWGGYKAWAGPEPPESQPVAWHIGFWANQVEGLEPDELYLERLVWAVEIPFERVHVDPVGLAEFPQKPAEMSFMCEVQLEPEEWFHQDEFPSNESVFWISITAIYPPDAEAANMWGWATRPYLWGRGAVMPTLMGEWPTYDERLFPGRIYPIESSLLCGESRPYDMCFELLTEQPWIKWDQPFTNLREWPHYQDEQSRGILISDEEQITHLVADDWFCERNTPVVAAAWSGSYIGYGYEACECEQGAQPLRPDYFLLQMRTGDADMQGDVIWEYRAYDYEEVLVGFDKDPEGEPNEPVYRYSVRLPEESWFRQESLGGLHWFSVAAVYADPLPQIVNPWGWTNHPHAFETGALAIDTTEPGEPQWRPLRDPENHPVDMSFTLYTLP